MSQKKSTLRQIFLVATSVGSILLAQGCERIKEVDSGTPLSGKITAESAQNNRAKNVILFIGDGMGVSTVTAGRIFDGQSQGKTGEEHVLAFEDFDHVAMIKTYNYDAQVPDSAGTATAIMSGYKARIGTLNVPPALLPDNRAQTCDISAMPATLSRRAKAAGLSVGVISTARLTHATPAAMYSHSAARGWEAAKDVPEALKQAGCTPIAEQALMADNGVDIMLGGGAKEFDKKALSITGEKDDTIMLPNVAAFRALLPSTAGRIFGLFTASHMSFEADRDNDKEPSLAEMTGFAIDNLSARGTGYVLMVEAGRIDHAHHGTNAYRALRDLQALNEAVKVAKAKMGDDTLILVTADHSHVFTMAGYPVRGNPILGLVRHSDFETNTPEKGYAMAEDGKPYTTLGYGNGPNVRTEDSPALTDNMVQAKDFRQQTAIKLGSETHGGEDVTLYATGPGAAQVRGVMEQNKIHNVITDALGIEGFK